MQGSALLATHWYPSSDLMGPGSIWPGAMVGLCALLAWRTRLPAVFLTGSILLLVLALLTQVSPLASGRRFPDAHDFVGYYLLLGGAAVAAMELGRRGALLWLLLAEPLLFAAGWLLVLELVQLVQRMPWRVFEPMSDRMELLLSAALWLPLFAVASWRVAGPYRARRRVERGCCPHCGYDLRESPERCPECGEAASSGR